MPITLTPSGVPWARYKVTTNKLTFSMEGQTGEVDFKGLQFAADPENATIGWLQIVEKTRNFVAGALNQPPPKQPSAEHKWTLGLLIYSPKAMGDTVFEICDTSFAYRNFAEHLFNRAEPEFGKGNVPMIRIVDTLIVPTSNGSTTRILFEIEKWIPRPDCFLEAIKLRDSAAAAKPDNGAEAAKPDHPPGNAYAAATGRDPLAIGRRDLDDEIPFGL